MKGRSRHIRLLAAPAHSFDRMVDRSIGRRSADVHRFAQSTSMAMSARPPVRPPRARARLTVAIAEAHPYNNHSNNHINTNNKNKK
jgi:hypothetical protein